MQSSLASSCGWLMRKNAQSILVPRCHYRGSLSSGCRTSKSLMARQFSERKIPGGSSSANNQRHRSYFYSIFEWYSKKLDTHPILTKCISAGLVSSVGNVLAQVITYRQEQQLQADDSKRSQSKQQPFEVNLAQVSRFVLLNVTFVAPVLHHWYQFINRTVPGKSLSRVLQRTFWDEFVFSPIYIPAFLSMLWKLEGNTSENIFKMIKSECPSIIVAEWFLWVPTMIATFRYVPVKFQVLVINVVGVVWNTFLAYAANNAHSSSSEKGNDNGNGNEDVMEKKVQEAV